MSRGVRDTSLLIANDLQPLPGELAISVISLAELHYGVLVAKSADARATRLARLTGRQRRSTHSPWTSPSPRATGGWQRAWSPQAVTLAGARWTS